LHRQHISLPPKHGIRFHANENFTAIAVKLAIHVICFKNSTLEGAMNIATYNVNGFNGRLANLLKWLKESNPGIVCLKELKAPTGKFP
jgi:hypothetical protein